MEHLIKLRELDLTMNPIRDDEIDIVGRTHVTDPNMLGILPEWIVQRIVKYCQEKVKKVQEGG